jgi:hypothetical protein
MKNLGGCMAWAASKVLESMFFVACAIFFLVVVVVMSVFVDVVTCVFVSLAGLEKDLLVMVEDYVVCIAYYAHLQSRLLSSLYQQQRRWHS